MNPTESMPAAASGLEAARPARLDAATVAGLVEDYFRVADARPWSRLMSFDWAAIRPEMLTDPQRSVVQFVTLIEDHLPGYFSEYLRLFPLGEQDLETFVHNREVYHFGVRWAQEEDGHAHVLFLYQVHSGIAEPAALRLRLAEEGRKHFGLPHAHPVQLFTYTLVQEKATQIFYQRFAAVVKEPVLKEILNCLVRDESRHFAFFSRVIEAYTRQFGNQIIEPIKEVLAKFRMPLGDTLRDYWRWSVAVIDAVGGYNHEEAFDELVRAVRLGAESASNSKTADLATFVESLSRVRAGRPA